MHETEPKQDLKAKTLGLVILDRKNAVEVAQKEVVKASNLLDQQQITTARKKLRAAIQRRQVTEDYLHRHF